ncbi:class I SAM-dependent methyltransferase [Roseimaritima sediminicola]|uniref:class I SAM-dependent methyltransferase n=1 Tax=Roseimaritima sediminicola TaxID=2662066 RepID=UPI0012985322|nr:class I SAM-dependent methyltransferase [Roseimaritima sediminicola]
MRQLGWVLSLLLLPAGLVAQPPVAPPRTVDPPAADQRPANLPEGINRNFVDPDMDIAEWLGRFEIESREVFAARQQVLEACEIRPGDRIADVGAGTGFYSRLFAEHSLPGGWVYAVDISPVFLQHITEQALDDGVTNLTAVLGTSLSVTLPPESVDLVFICDTYHHFEYPPRTLASIRRALKPGGRLVLIDFERIPGVTREFLMNHVRAGKETFRREVLQAGFEFRDEVSIDGFEENYLLRFRKPQAAEASAAQ